MRNRIDICVVHYNTPLLMDALLKSISLHVPSYNLHILDNSDESPYVTDNKSIHYIDNTIGQLINFDEWIEGYPDRITSSARLNGWGSAKHCYSVQKMIEIIGKPFILLDSDVLLKKDISDLYDIRYVAVGDVSLSPKIWNPRLHPMICFINPGLMSEIGTRYFDEDRILGLRHGAHGDRYDTGGSFYEDIKDSGKVRYINALDYVVHYGSGSWIAKARRDAGKITQEEWLDRNKAYWDNAPSKIESLTI